MHPEELEKILAEQKEKDALLEHLFEAVISKNLETVKSICEKNKPTAKDVINETNLINKKSKTLLECAADSEMAKYLIEQGADLSIAVTQAVQRNDLEVVKSICEKNKSIIKRTLQGKSNPLKYATNDNHFNNEIVEYLIKQGANPNIMVHGKCDLLHLQIAQGHFKGAIALIKNGANVDTQNQEEDYYVFGSIDDSAFCGDTSLHFAIRAYEKNKGRKPEKAQQALELIHFLIKESANINAQNIHKRIPLYIAVRLDAPEVVKLLMEAGADVNIKSDNGKTALDLAKEENNQELITLLENGRQSIVNGATWQQQAETPEENDPRPAKQQPTNDSTKRLMNFSPREVAVISIAAISCALALYFLAPLILGATVGVVAKLALEFAGAIAGGGIGYLINIVIDKFCSNEVAEQIV